MRLPLLVELSFAGTLAANVVGWAAAHAGTGYAAHRIHRRRLAHDGTVLRVRGWEVHVHRALRVRHWKDRLPEAGALFPGGLSKRHLSGGVERFAQETRRAERAHWWALAAVPVFSLWNPVSGVLLMAGYGVV